MRMRAALDPPVQHAWHLHVGTKIGPAHDLVDPIGADGAGADNLQLEFLGGRCHSRPSHLLYSRRYSDHGVRSPFMQRTDGHCFQVIAEHDADDFVYDPTSSILSTQPMSPREGVGSIIGREAWGARMKASMKQFDLGRHTRPISTNSTEAQRWFDLGLNWCFGFNHEEGVKCFQMALKADPGCVM